jgi:hypothetical protein
MNFFNEMANIVSDTNLYDKLTEAAIMWDMLTDDGKNISDDNLLLVLISNNLDYLATEYLVHKDGDSFDWDGFKKEMKDWAFLN